MRHLAFTIVLLCASAAAQVQLGLSQGPPNYLGSSRSVAALGTLSAAFGTGNPFNSTAHSPLNPSTNCITRLIDRNVVQYGTSTQMDDNFSTGNFTFSGGSQDLMTNTNATLIGMKANGGTTWIFQTGVTNGCLQNITNGGTGNPSVNKGGPFSFSTVNPNVFYTVTSNYQLNQYTVNTSVVPMTATTTANANFPFDFTNCPGIAGLVANGTPGTSGSILRPSLGDTEFSADISWDGGQGTAHVAMVYKPGSGCASIDLAPTNKLSGTASITAGVATVTTLIKPQYPNAQTGSITGASNSNFNCANATFGTSTSTTVNYTCSPALSDTGSTTLTTGTIVGHFANVYGFCAATCQSANPVGQETVCFDPDYLTGGGGIHDTIITFDGNMIRIAGGCFSLASGNTAFWQIGTTTVLGRAVGTSSWNPGNGYAWSGHPSDGITHVFLTNDPTPNNRVESPVSTGGLSGYVPLVTLPSGASASGGFHASQAHPYGDDDNPVLIESANSVGFTTPGSMLLTYLENEIFGVDPANASAPVIRFAPTYNSSTSGGFSCQDGIGYQSQDGRWAFFLSDQFQNLGLDSQGNQLCSAFAVALN